MQNVLSSQLICSSLTESVVGVVESSVSHLRVRLSGWLNPSILNPEFGVKLTTCNIYAHTQFVFRGGKKGRWNKRRDDTTHNKEIILITLTASHGPTGVGRS